MCDAPYARFIEKIDLDNNIWHGSKKGEIGLHAGLDSIPHCYLELKCKQVI
jgi:hypothetical protein